MARRRDAVTNYYNEIDPYAAHWLRNLIDAGRIPAGDVDERSIVDVSTADITGYTQCHFFAGIGGWPYALRLAGWDADRAVWTGSCPCQPFSCAGKREGESDERHLWPEFRRLIAEREPATVFGEQTYSKDAKIWLAGVRTDLEALGYGLGAADLGVAGIDAPHPRQRLFWLADAGGNRCGQKRAGCPKAGRDGVERNGSAGGLADAGGAKRRRGGEPEGARGAVLHPADRCETGGLGDSDGDGYQERTPDGGEYEAEARKAPGQAAQDAGAWSDFELIGCADGKVRRIEPGTFPLAYGLPRSVGPGGAKQQRVELMAAKANRTGRLKGYGNSINPYVAAEFIRAAI